MNFLFKCEAILFDLDGVLVDSRACVEKHWKQWALRNDLDPEYVLSNIHGKRIHENIRLLTPHLNPEEESQWISSREQFDTDGVHEIEGAKDLLNSLNGNLWAIATSGNFHTANTRITHTHLPKPKVLITADDVKEGKPNPEPYMKAASNLGIKPCSCLVIEDAPSGIKAAKSAGMSCIAVATTHAASLLKKADCVIHSLHDMIVTPKPKHIEIGIL